MIEAAKEASNTPFVLDAEKKINKLYEKGAAAVKQLSEQAGDNLHTLKRRVHLGGVPDKYFHIVFVVMLVLVSWLAYDRTQKWMNPPQRHSVYTTPGMNKAEDSLYEILGEIKQASDDAFQKATSEVQSYAKKAKSGSTSGVEESYNAALRAIKSLQGSLTQVETKATNSLQDILSKAKSTIKDKVCD